ncbi:S41 family peptidase [Lutibacter sp.]
MKIRIFLMAAFVTAFSLLSCNNDNDPNIDVSNVEVQDFIWRGLNTYYLWKDNVPNLANTKNDNATTYLALLNSYSNPADFFESLIYDRQNTDKWSWIVDDYVALENSFQGISKSNGVKYGLVYENGSTVNIFGYVRYILPNSDAATKNVQRGYIFDAINGVQLTVDNYSSLLANDTYTMNFADLNGGNPVSNGMSVQLTKTAYQENPVYITNTFNINGEKIGYIMYNSFTSTYDSALNAAFAQIKADGATSLILDLRYNGGGSVRTATYLAGMITGQFNGQLFTKERWNNELQDWFETNHPDWLVNNFTNEIYNTDTNGNVLLQEAINSLNLSTLYVITTGSSASASELIINGLNPYINVITVGTKTHGKYTASVTLYDSENFGREGVNPNHTWAMQPIVLEEVNKLGVNDKDGFDPTYELSETLTNFGQLGDVNEPLLAYTISIITNTPPPLAVNSRVENNPLIEVDLPALDRFENTMYVEKQLPYDFGRFNN